MRVRVLLFAQYREFAGTSALEVDLPDGATAGALVAVLRGRGGGLERIPATTAVAVNLEYASSETPLRDGDEVALIPPVAGG
ncbi:MAG: molybdopterin converting factor subunit 1 [bacterium]|jgi:molybdopterin converting factor subunit 1|nr:MAG: molybdopterin converting factor subunit 1 [bacterium]